MGASSRQKAIELGKNGVPLTWNPGPSGVASGSGAGCGASEPTRHAARASSNSPSSMQMLVPDSPLQTFVGAQVRVARIYPGPPSTPFAPTPAGMPAGGPVAWVPLRVTNSNC
jgi:hypothetical protein